jgi:hypothetical protein
LAKPFGAILLAAFTFVQGLYQAYLAAVYMGWATFEIIGIDVKFTDPKWGYVIMSVILAAIYFWVSYGFWGVRLWAWLYGVIISGFNVFWLLLLVLGDVTLEAVIVPVLISGGVLLYLLYPGTKEAFVASEVEKAVEG